MKEIVVIKDLLCSHSLNKIHFYIMSNIIYRLKGGEGGHSDVTYMFWWGVDHKRLGTTGVSEMC